MSLTVGLGGGGDDCCWEQPVMESARSRVATNKPTVNVREDFNISMHPFFISIIDIISILFKYKKNVPRSCQTEPLNSKNNSLPSEYTVVFGIPKGVSFIDEGIQILNMLRYRLYLPIAVVADRIFSGNRARADEIISDLERGGLIEYANDNHITLTSAGKMLLNRHRLLK